MAQTQKGTKTLSDSKESVPLLDRILERLCLDKHSDKDAFFSILGVVIGFLGAVSVALSLIYRGEISPLIYEFMLGFGIGGVVGGYIMWLLAFGD